jgi:uncharacterized protein YkwD
MKKYQIFLYLIGLQIYFFSQELSGFDYKLITNTWLEWNNQLRRELGLKEYQYQESLEKTALLWSQIANERGKINHKRDTADEQFYNYPAIEEWFKTQGLVFKNIKGFTFTENIGWGYFKYQGGDKTLEIIQAISSTFDFFLSERDKVDKWENAHYRSLTAPYFNYIGIGLIINEEKNCYYITIHYGTELAGE